MIPSPASTELTRTAYQAAEDAQCYRTVLHELIDAGAERARQVHGQAKQADAGAMAGLAAAFERISRAVRRSIALALTLSDPVPPGAANDDAGRRAAARKRVVREVEDAIQRRAGEGDAEALHGERPDRPDASDLDDVRGRPVADVIASICRDLGLDAVPGTRPATPRTPAEIVALPARAATLPAALADPGDMPPGELQQPSAEGSPRLAPGLVALPPSGAAGGDVRSGLTGNPTTFLLNAARFRGK